MRFRNVSGDTLDVPALGIRAVEPNHEITVEGEDAKALERSEQWSRVDKPKQKATAADQDPAEPPAS